MSISIDNKIIRSSRAGGKDVFNNNNNTNTNTERTHPESLLREKSMVNDSISDHVGKISIHTLRLKKEVLASPTVN
jgi:hypothetical protein